VHLLSSSSPPEDQRRSFQICASCCINRMSSSIVGWISSSKCLVLLDVSSTKPSMYKVMVCCWSGVLKTLPWALRAWQSNRVLDMKSQ
jgi:hypothetical protein